MLFAVGLKETTVKQICTDIVLFLRSVFPSCVSDLPRFINNSASDRLMYSVVHAFFAR